jgi:hypothetical protein
MATGLIFLHNKSEKEETNKEVQLLSSYCKAESWAEFAYRWEHNFGLVEWKGHNLLKCNFGVRGFGNYENMFNNLE